MQAQQLQCPTQHNDQSCVRTDAAQQLQMPDVAKKCATHDEAYPVGPPAAEAASEMRRRKIVAADPGGKGAPALAASSDSVIRA